MEVKPGYKQTEVGVIPEDWESSKIGDFSFVTKLAGFEYTLHFDYSKSGPVIAVRALNIKNGTLDLKEVHTIPRKTSDDLPRSKLVKGDLVISYVGTLGRVAMIPEDDKFHLAPNVAKICVDKARVAPEFLAQFLNSFNGQKLIFDAAASTTQAALSMGNLREIVFVRPPLPEQRAIATALSNVDALLAALDRLIAKQRDLKQAAMQQLLTGQTRLPGFNGEWVVKTLDEIADVIDPHPSHRAPDEVSNGVPFVGIGDLDQNGNIVGSKLRYVDRSVLNEHADRYCLNDGLIGLGRVASIGKVVCLQALAEGYAVSPTLGIIRGRTAKREYLLYALRSKFITEQFTRIMSGSTRSSVGMEVLRKLNVLLPNSSEEQTAISAVLTDMDAALTALEQRRDKTRALKQGMMQELLTGRIRLV